MAARRDDQTEDTPMPVLDWHIDCADADRAAPKQGFENSYTATEAERQAIAEALDLTACSALSVRLKARARAGGRYLVSGRFEADIEQVCVVTLDPIHSHLNETFAGEFCPASDLAEAAPSDAHFDPDGDDEPMAIADGRLEVGQLVYEHLVLAVDPFPRQADAEQVLIERGPGGQAQTASKTGTGDADGKPNPFAALAKLRLGKDD